MHKQSFVFDKVVPSVQQKLMDLRLLSSGIVYNAKALSVSIFASISQEFYFSTAERCWMYYKKTIYFCRKKKYPGLMPSVNFLLHLLRKKVYLYLKTQPRHNFSIAILFIRLVFFSTR